MSEYLNGILTHMQIDRHRKPDRQRKRKWIIDEGAGNERMGKWAKSSLSRFRRSKVREMTLTPADPYGGIESPPQQRMTCILC